MNRTKSNKIICTKCIYDNTMPTVIFDKQGVCNYCKIIDDLKNQYGTEQKEGKDQLKFILDEIKKSGEKKKYDVIVGLSGGTDSSFLLHKSIEWGLRPLAVHYDNTWNTAIATENIRKMTQKLNVDLYTLVVDNKESNDIARSFFYANVPEIDGPTDIALSETLYRAASKFGIKYVLEGHSFIAEGISPLSNAYIDGGYIKDVHKKFGSLKMKTFPNMTFFSFLKWVTLYRIKKIRPYWYIKYSKKEAKSILKKEYDWKDYGGHHLENRLTAFNHSVYFPQKFNEDQRNNTISARVRSGEISQLEGLKEFNEPPFVEKELINYFKKRIQVSDDEYNKIMKGEKKSYLDYYTYKKRFELFRPLFYLLAKSNLVPMSFYLKYCKPLKKNENFDFNN
jgi:N-acetyl sugar amidotransferase